MGLLSLLGSLSPIHIHLVTFLTRARRMGRDGYGNTYFQTKARRGYHHPRRWVIYRGAAEPSMIPPEWHGWLHYQTDTLPDQQNHENFRRTWQKPYQPNLTGTDSAYLPPGHVLRGFKRGSATGDYTAWVPEQVSLTKALEKNITEKVPEQTSEKISPTLVDRNT